MHRTDVKPRAEVLAEMAAWLEREHGVTMLGGARLRERLCAGDAAERAPQALGIRTIADLARPRAEPVDRRRLRVLRPAGMGRRSARPMASHFREQRQMQPEFMYPAVGDGEVDVIAAYTSDGRIAQYDLVVLDDPKHAIPPYDAVLLVSPQRANDAALLAALRPLVGAIDVTLMREANLRASGGDNASPGEAARWLWSEIQRKKAATPAAQRQRVDAEIIVRRRSTPRPASSRRRAPARRTTRPSTCSCSRCGWFRRRGTRCIRRRP